jgi:hypothetical protein
VSDLHRIEGLAQAIRDDADMIGKWADGNYSGDVARRRHAAARIEANAKTVGDLAFGVRSNLKKIGADVNRAALEAQRRGLW